jgi:hypothetical protein
MTGVHAAFFLLFGYGRRLSFSILNPVSAADSEIGFQFIMSLGMSQGFGFRIVALSGLSKTLPLKLAE